MCFHVGAEAPALLELYEWSLPLAEAASAGCLSASQAAGFKRRLHSECLPALAAAAAAAQQHREQRPWIQQAEEQLHGRLAAATRSCAYLRCANLGGEGGPAAGQGVGSMRCR